MVCETCGHTMECHYAAAGEAIYHCPRCGTLAHIEGRGDDRKCKTFVPMLVNRCRVYYDEAVTNMELPKQ